MEKFNIPENSWKEQYARVKRWYKRTLPISRDRVNISENDIDTLYAFFINCHHLKDWLIHSKVMNDNDINNFFKRDETMIFSYEICTGAKHLRMTEKKIRQNTLLKSFEYMGEKIGEVPTQLFLFKGGHQNLAVLADASMQKLEGFLKMNKLI